MTTITYIRSDRDLRRAARQLRHKHIGLDTEFVHRNTYYPLASLVQLAAGSNAFLIDIPALSDLSPLTQLLTSPDIEKIIHSGRQDCEILQRICGSPPVPAFDTQLAAAFLGFEAQISYKRLLEEKTGVILDKTQTNSNWMRRPLTKKQINYAAADVIYLGQLRTLLANELQAQNKSRWFEEESRNREKADYNFCNQFLSRERHKSTARYAAVKHLIEWREKQAQTENLPRRWVLSDQCIHRIAQLYGASHNPTSQNLTKLMQQIPECRKFCHRADTLPQLLRNSHNHTLQQPISRPQFDEAIKRSLDLLKDALLQTARKHGISPALVANRKQLVTIARSRGAKNPLTGWRAEMMRECLTQLYSS